MRSIQLADGTFYYPNLGWANYTYYKSGELAEKWAECLDKGDADKAQEYYNRFMAVRDAFYAQTETDY